MYARVGAGARWRLGGRAGGRAGGRVCVSWLFFIARAGEHARVRASVHLFIYIYINHARCIILQRRTATKEDVDLCRASVYQLSAHRSRVPIRDNSDPRLFETRGNEI